MRLPQRGDLVEVTGRLTAIDFRLNTSQVPVLDELTSYRILHSDAPPLGDIGQPYQHDMDCQDDLICQRNPVPRQPKHTVRGRSPLKICLVVDSPQGRRSVFDHGLPLRYSFLGSETPTSRGR